MKKLSLWAVRGCTHLSINAIQKLWFNRAYEFGKVYWVALIVDLINYYKMKPVKFVTY